MDVLVIATNRCRDPSPVVPLGACMAATAAAQAGHRVRLLDLMFEPHPAAAIAGESAVRLPQVAALSLRNLDNAEFSRPRSFLPQARSLVHRLRMAGVEQIVVGGAASGIAPELLRRHLEADFVLAGHGADAFASLLEQLAGGAPAAGPPARLCRGADWVEPDLPRWVDLRRYRAHLAPIPVQTKRGCPYRCVYCTYPAIEGRAPVLRDPERVVESVARLARHGVASVEFVDSVFNAPPAHALALCEALARRPLPVSCSAYSLNPGDLDPELLGAMAAARFAGFGLTAESAADPVLRALGKDYGRDDLERTARHLRRSPLPVLWIYLLGGPGETLATARQTLAFARSALRPGDAAFFSLGVRIYPGTPLEDLARSQDLLEEGEDLLYPRFYCPPGLDLATLGDLLARAIAEEPRFLSSGLGGWRLRSVLQRGAAALGVEPPLWRHAGALRRALGVLGLGG